ncbi:MAG: MFS transporter [Burkholderiales bacterium]
MASMASIRIADPMLPALARDFGGEPAGAAATITLFALAYGTMQLVWGPLGDRVGKLRVIAWAALAATLGSLACALAPTLAWLAGARLATGACCAAIIPLAIAYVGDTVDYSVRQATLARLSTGTLTGMIAGQVLGGAAADTVGWRVAFVVLAAVFLVTGTAALRMQARLAGAARPVPPGAATTAISLLRGWHAGLAGGWSRRVIGFALVEGALMFGALAFVPTWLHERAGLSLAAAGGAVAAMGAGGLAYAAFASRLIPLLGERGTLTLGGALVALGLAALAASPAAGLGTPTWIVAIAACGVAGVGFYMLHNTMQTLATQLAPHARATAIGLFAVALFVGQSVGVSVAAPVGAALGHAAVIAAAGVAMAVLGAGLGRAVARRRAT